MTGSGLLWSTRRRHPAGPEPRVSARQMSTLLSVRGSRTGRDGASSRPGKEQWKNKGGGGGRKPAKD